MLEELFAFVVEELCLVQQRFPEKTKAMFPDILQLMKMGKMVVRWYSAPKWSEYKHYSCFYGYLFGKQMALEILPTLEVKKNVAALLPYTFFAERKDDLFLLTPLEAWLYLCLDEQRQKGNASEELFVVEENKTAMMFVKQLESMMHMGVIL